MSFYYRHTCPDIDRSINHLRDEIRNELVSLVGECSPLLVGEDRDFFIESYADQIYNSIENNFEDVRKTNEDMRKEAERQIDDLENQIHDLESDISSLTDKVNYLSEEIDDLQDELKSISV